MDTQLYEQYLVFQKAGRKAEAKSTLTAFIASFRSTDEIRPWVHAFLEQSPLPVRIRHEIYTDLIFPILLEGYRQNNAGSKYWLAVTIQNLYAAKALHAAVDFKTDF